MHERVAGRIWQRLSAAVTPEQRTDLEGLLARAGGTRITNLERCAVLHHLRVHPSWFKVASSPLGSTQARRRPTGIGKCTRGSAQGLGAVCRDHQSRNI